MYSHIITNPWSRRRHGKQKNKHFQERITQGNGNPKNTNKRHNRLKDRDSLEATQNVDFCVQASSFRAWRCLCRVPTLVTCWVSCKCEPIKRTDASRGSVAIWRQHLLISYLAGPVLLAKILKMKRAAVRTRRGETVSERYSYHIW